MIEDRKISLKIKFQNRKFEININPLAKILKLKENIKNLLIKIKDINDYKFTNLNENNFYIKRLNEANLILNEKYDSKTIKELGIKEEDELEVGNIDREKNIKNHNKQNEIFIGKIEINPKDKDEKVEKEENYLDKELLNKFSVYRKVIPGDNSCMFNAVNYALYQCMTEPQILRELIAIEIKSNPELYDKAVLEADPEDYCDWIMRKDSWGGGIELSILSKYFRIRIDVIDIKNDTIEMIGDVN